MRTTRAVTTRIIISHSASKIPEGVSIRRSANAYCTARDRCSAAPTSALKIWENPNHGMQGKPYFQVLVFPDQEACKIIGVIDSELHVGINVPRNQGNVTLLPFLKTALNLSDEYRLVISGAYAKKRRKWIRIERIDGKSITLDEMAGFFSALSLATEKLGTQPELPIQPES